MDKHRYIHPFYIIPIILFITIAFTEISAMFLPPVTAQTLHGDIDISCHSCHSDEYPDALRNEMDFDHNQTDFPLTGSHLSLLCSNCHTDRIFPGTPKSCAECHDDIHNRALGSDCARCHSTVTFTISDDFNGFHETTRFPLRGIHRTLSCGDCHEETSDEWKGLDTACVSCHYDDYQASDSFDHIEAGFGTDCIHCHTETSGFSVLFDHNTTGTELTGAHVFLDCGECHRGGFFNTLPKDCSVCHTDDYYATTSPSHQDAGFSTACDDCHSTVAWIPANFSSGHTTYPLNGIHAALTCAECHTEDYESPLPTTCVGCHESDYQTAGDPDHEILSLAYSCETCHTENSWTPSTYDHTDTGFILAGSHTSIGCNACHTSSVGTRLPNDCYSCHTDDYMSAPDHSSLGYGTNCLDCHNQISWEGAIFEHESFPIYSGEHRGEWSSCSECHTDPAHPSLFSCLGCHEESQTTNWHRNIGSYVYQSEACYNCHRSGI